MFRLPPMFIFWVCAAIVVGLVGYIIYGFIKGFENTFTDED
jgi:hypothetical protein